MYNIALKITFLLIVLSGSSQARAESLNVAVASNFLKTMRDLSVVYEELSGHHLNISAGSSGKHFAQIKQGAPYDVFLSADSIRPKRLEEEGLAVEGSRLTYAIGRLALWGKSTSSVQLEASALEKPSISRFSIANPRLAPYGVAAKEVLLSLERFDVLEPILAKGENINQAYQFLATGNADLGFVSLAQMKQAGHIDYWLVPSELHSPIEQQLVLINNSEAAQQLSQFMQSDKAKEIIQQHGYDLP